MSFTTLQDCLPAEHDNEYECLQCRVMHQNVKRMLASHVQSASNHDEVREKQCQTHATIILISAPLSLAPPFSLFAQFTKQLEGAENRFSVIANYFGLNLFREVRLNFVFSSIRFISLPSARCFASLISSVLLSLSLFLTPC